MSGWDASSRPSWDQHNGTGENTQSFGIPDFPEDSGGFPSSASPGTPPAIFLQDYDKNDVAPNQFDGSEFGGNEFAGFAGNPGQPNNPGQPGYPNYPNYPGQPSQPGQDYPRNPLGQPDADHAARFDPALRDFFAPQSTREGRQDPGPGPRSHPGHGQPGRHQANGYRQPNGRQANGYRQPGGPGDGRIPPGRWDTAGPRQGSRSARRQQTRSGRRGLTIAIAIVVVLAAAIGGYLAVHHTGSKSPAGTPATTAGTQSGKTAKNPATSPAKKTSTGTAKSAARYTLTVPRTAGGYHALTSIPTAMRSSAGTTEQAIAAAVLKNGGGKIVGKGVAAAYGLSGGQAMTYLGYQGTFDPAKVVTGLAGFGEREHQYSPGTHGGQFGCVTAPATAPGTPRGTVCVWVTRTTFAVTEFFGATGPEAVTDQSKAAADTLKVRNSVELPKK